MVSISSFIRQKKESFQSFKHNQQLRREQALKEEALARRQKAAELAKAQAERVRAEADLQKIEGFTQRHTQPSKLQRFGQGLARVMNEQKARSAKSGGGPFGQASPGRARKAGGALAKINEGSRGLPFGGNNTNESAFSQAARPLDYGRPAPVVNKPPARKVIIIR